MMKWQITRNVKDETPEQRDTKRFAVVKCQSDTQLVVCVCVRACVCLKLTPVAWTGEAEPAGTGEAWR